MDNRIYGYCRVSDKDQNEARQIEELLNFGVSKRNIKIDKASGKNFNRKAYLSLVGTDTTDSELRQGDLLVVLSIDRLGRNYTEIMEQWRYITQVIKADVKVLDLPLLDTRQIADTLDSRFIANLFLEIISYVAQKERENIRHRQRQGIDIMPVVDGKRLSTKTGNPTGRPPSDYPQGWETVYQQWQNREITAVEAMKRLNIRKTTFYKLAKMETKGG